MALFDIPPQPFVLYEILNYWISELRWLSPESSQGPIYYAMKLLVLPDYICFFSIVTVLALCCTLFYFITSKAPISITYALTST